MMDLTGKKFGKLTVISSNGRATGEDYYEKRTIIN